MRYLWCGPALSYSVITTIMDGTVQLINPLNLGELYAALQSPVS
jgi:hypothetical protein